MPVIRKKLDANAVYPENMRYNADTDQVETLVNGTWTPSPQADPRKQTIFPPRVTADTACDAAQSVTDAFKNQIDQILTAIDNGGTAFTIAGIILSLFTFGPFGVFISIALAIANAMLDAGTTALSAALTPTVYHTFTCILMCHMDSQGRIDAAGLAAAESDITDQIGGLAAIILNSMLSLAGEGGVSNLAALGTSDGDCSDCDTCNWCYEWTGSLLADGWTYVVRGDGALTHYAGGKFVGGSTSTGAARIVDVAIGITGHVTHFECDYEWVRTVSSGGLNAIQAIADSIAITTSPDMTGSGFDTIVADGSWASPIIRFTGGVYDGTGTINITRVLMRGTGDNPIGENNC